MSNNELEDDFNGTYTIDITNNSDYSSSLFTSTPYENATTVKRIDLDLLEKYPAAKSLYNQFISVYNMCEAEEELNGESNAGTSF